MTSENLSLPFFQDPAVISSLSSRTPVSEVLAETIRAEVPVPDQLRSRSKELKLLRQLKLSQKIGIIAYLIELGSEAPGVIQRLQRLQSIASMEAIEAGLKFKEQLKSTPKLVSDFKHIMYFFLSENYRIPLQSKLPRKQRIRGYRDKGTLPDVSRKARNRAQEEGWIDLRGLEEMSVKQFLLDNLPSELFEGDSLYLPGAFEYLQEEKEILHRLEEILLRL